jgi:20S proteasome alpha/beta subunit
VSYIAALRCGGEGIVLVADTQETYGDQKQYTEKLAVSPDRIYPLAVGGAGIDVLTDAFPQELVERVTANPPKTKQELIKIATDAIGEVYRRDVPVAVLSKQARTAEFLVAYKTMSEDFVLLRLKGNRVYEVKGNYAVIGFATAANKALLKRMYRENLTMHRAVLLASYLVSQSKEIDTYVLSGQAKSGQWWSGQNRPTDVVRDVISFSPFSPGPASPFSCASSLARISGCDRGVAGGRAWR